MNKIPDEGGLCWKLGKQGIETLVHTMLMQKAKYIYGYNSKFGGILETQQ